MDHLHHELEPFRLEVVAFVDQYRVVLRGRDQLLIDGADHLVHAGFEEGRRVLARWRLADVVGVQLAHAPCMEVHHVDLVLQALGFDDLRQLGGERLVIAKHEDRALAHLRQVFGAVAEDQGFAGTRHAVNHAMAFAKAARELFLLDVHHAQDLGDLGRGLAGCGKQIVLRRDAHFRKHVPANPVDLRQRQLQRELAREHVP